MSSIHADEHEIFIGRLVAAFQSLELALVELLSVLVNASDQEVGYIVSDGLSFKKLVACVDALVRRRDSKTEDPESMKVMVECLALEEIRNRFVHGYWDIASTNDDKITWMWFKRRNRVGKGHQYSEQHLDFDLDAFVDRCRAAEACILKLRK